MKNLKKAERAVIALTVLCLIFTAGYFAGRSAAVQVISIDKLAAVPVPVLISPIPTQSPAISSKSPGFSEKININTASSATLEGLPGIGSVLAQSIIDYRNKNGSFKSIEQIMAIDGIGEEKFNAMKDMIAVG